VKPAKREFPGDRVGGRQYSSLYFSHLPIIG
jgi:hypothetical protein